MNSAATATAHAPEYRGEELRADAERHIVVSGCSLTFGSGPDCQDTWASVVQRGYARIHDTPLSAVNLLDLSAADASNGYIARTLIGQCERCRPSLALAVLTCADRIELLHDGRAYHIGQWCLRDSFEDDAADQDDRQLRRLIREKAAAHYELYTPLSGAQDLLKNALLLQLFFETRRIPFLIAIVRSDYELPGDAILAPWRDALDPARVFTILRRDCLVDESASRPGRLGSLVIAEAFLSRYRALAERVHHHSRVSLDA
jgi:hypothetical protein